MKMWEILKNKLNALSDDYISKRNIKRLHNHDFTIISSNCNGGVMLRDLKQPFDTPTINLWFTPREYLKLVSDLKRYLNCELLFDSDNSLSYPVGVLDDIRVYFQHYESKEEAKKKWDERVKRVHYDNLFYLFTDRDGCTYQDLMHFDSLPFKHKVVFTYKKYNDIKSSFYKRGFERGNQVGVLSNYRHFLLGLKYYDSFDYVKWLNGNWNQAIPHTIQEEEKGSGE